MSTYILIHIIHVIIYMYIYTYIYIYIARHLPQTPKKLPIIGLFCNYRAILQQIAFEIRYPLHLRHPVLVGFTCWRIGFYVVTYDRFQ